MLCIIMLKKIAKIPRRRYNTYIDDFFYRSRETHYGRVTIIAQSAHTLIRPGTVVSDFGSGDHHSRIDQGTETAPDYMIFVGVSIGVTTRIWTCGGV